MWGRGEDIDQKMLQSPLDQVVPMNIWQQHVGVSTCRCLFMLKKKMWARVFVKKEKNMWVCTYVEKKTQYVSLMCFVEKKKKNNMWGCGFV